MGNFKGMCESECKGEDTSEEINSILKIQIVIITINSDNSYDYYVVFVDNDHSDFYPLKASC